MSKSLIVDLGLFWVANCDLHKNYATGDTEQELADLTTFDFCDCCSGDCTPFCANTHEGEEA